jgi:hypothetical protein
MFHSHVRAALLTGVVLAAAGLPARACAPCACAPAPVTACAPAYRTVCVTEYVPENYQTTRTVYKAQCVTETYTAYRTECSAEQRVRKVCVNRMVPEVKEEVRTVYTCVPTVETRTVMKPVVTCKPVTTVVRKCVDMGHYEEKCVPAREGCLAKLRKCFHKKDCCPPPPPPMKVVKEWVPNKVWVETPVTRMVRSCDYVPTTVQVTVNRVVPQQQTYKVCVNRCVTEVKEETYTVLVPRQVPFQATRTVTRCVPVVETVTLCRMVPRVVQKQVPVTPCCGH